MIFTYFTYRHFRYFIITTRAETVSFVRTQARRRNVTDAAPLGPGHAVLAYTVRRAGRRIGIFRITSGYMFLAYTAFIGLFDLVITVRAHFISVEDIFFAHKTFAIGTSRHFSITGNTHEIFARGPVHFIIFSFDIAAAYFTCELLCHGNLRKDQ